MEFIPGYVWLAMLSWLDWACLAKAEYKHSKFRETFHQNLQTVSMTQLATVTINHQEDPRDLEAMPLFGRKYAE